MGNTTKIGPEPAWRTLTSAPLSYTSRKRPRVFVVHAHLTMDLDTRTLKFKHDMSSAEEYGELVFLLAPQANPVKNPQDCRDAIEDKLQDITAEDWILLVGSPVLIAWVAAIAADLLDGRLRLLQWNGTRKCYVPIDQQVLPPCGEDD